MQFKHVLVALLVLLAFVGTAAAADSVEIRSAVLDNSSDIPVATSFTGLTPVLTAANWAGFYADFDLPALGTEKIFMYNDGGELFIRYETAPVYQNYEYHFGNITNGGTPNALGYAILGFFAEPYVALGVNVSNNTTNGLNSVQANQIAKLVIDNDEKYLLKTGSTLELGDGYSIIVDQIDVDGNKALIGFYKDGKELNRSIISTGTHGDGMWTLTAKLFNKDPQVMRLHVSSVFQGTQDSLVEIEGIWVVDYLNAMEIKSDDDFGKWEGKSSSSVLAFEVDGFTVGNDEDLDLGKGIFLKSSDKFTAAATDKFYLYKKYTDAGTYEIRSTIYVVADIVSAPTDAVDEDGFFDFSNFAAFYYDLNNGVFVETMTVDDTPTASGEFNITYNMLDASNAYAFTGQADWITYNLTGFFGEKYVPLNVVDSDGLWTKTVLNKIGKLVIDEDEKYLLKTGSTLELGDGYSLIVDQIDVDGNKALIGFYKDGREINRSIVTTGTGESGNWILRNTVLGENNTQVLRVHVSSVFQGTQDSLVEIDGLWVMDYQNARELKTDDKVGEFEYKGAGKFVAEDIKFDKDDDKKIANNLHLKTSEDGLKYYFYVEATVGEGSTGPTQPDIPDVPDVTTPPTTPDTDDKPDVVTPPIVEDKDDEKGWFAKNWMYILAAIVLIIIIAGVAYYFLVMKKQ